VPYLARLRELGDASWREDARRLIEAMQAVRRVNNETFWRDQVAVAAWRGRETQIADLVEYACETTTKYLRDCLQSSVFR
jgi:hypothetical protein